MGHLRKMRRGSSSGRKKLGEAKAIGKQDMSKQDTGKRDTDVYTIPAEVWNSWDFATRFEAREIVEDESLTHAECAILLEKLVESKRLSKESSGDD